MWGVSSAPTPAFDFWRSTIRWATLALWVLPVLNSNLSCNKCPDDCWCRTWPDWPPLLPATILQSQPGRIDPLRAITRRRLQGSLWVLRQSRETMKGFRSNRLVLDLTLIGWYLNYFTRDVIGFIPCLTLSTAKLHFMIKSSRLNKGRAILQAIQAMKLNKSKKKPPASWGFLLCQLFIIYKPYRSP